MKLANRTTKVPAVRTIREIESMLAPAGACALQTEFGAGRAAAAGASGAPSRFERWVCGCACDQDEKRECTWDEAALGQLAMVARVRASEVPA